MGWTSHYIQKSAPEKLLMVRVISEPHRIKAHGQPPKVIEEFIGRVNSAPSAVSVARMKSLCG